MLGEARASAAAPCSMGPAAAQGTSGPDRAQRSLCCNLTVLRQCCSYMAASAVLSSPLSGAT